MPPEERVGSMNVDKREYGIMSNYTNDNANDKNETRKGHVVR
jgi:hypothetical protein